MHRPLWRKCWDNSLDTSALFSAVAELSWTTADISLIPRSTMEIADSRGKFSVFYESHKIYPPAGYFQVVANETISPWGYGRARSGQSLLKCFEELLLVKGLIHKAFCPDGLGLLKGVIICQG